VAGWGGLCGREKRSSLGPLSPQPFSWLPPGPHGLPAFWGDLGAGDLPVWWSDLGDPTARVESGGNDPWPLWPILFIRL